MADRNFLTAFIREEIYLVDRGESNSNQLSVAEEKYLMVTPYPLADHDREFLYKIFAAVNVPPELLKLTQLDQDPAGYKATFYFGVEPKDHSFEYYQKHLVQQKPLVVAHQLSEIASNNEKKRKLWSVLKSCFN